MTSDNQLSEAARKVLLAHKEAAAREGGGEEEKLRPMTDAEVLQNTARYVGCLPHCSWNDAKFCECGARQMWRLTRKRYKAIEARATAAEAALAEARAALRLHQAWSDSESTGPDYGGQSRDTHPDGELIWRKWWENQLDLCDRATKATSAFLAPPAAKGDSLEDADTTRVLDQMEREDML